MGVKILKKPSKTDWKRIDEMTDEEIDVSDSPPLDEDFFDRAEWRMPEKKTAVTLSVDSEVLKWFEGQGADFTKLVRKLAETICRSRCRNFETHNGRNQQQRSRQRFNNGIFRVASRR